MNWTEKVNGLVIACSVAMGLSAASVAHGFVLEDGEGTNASLAADYTLDGAAVRVAQMATEEPAVTIPHADGAAKYVFSVNSTTFNSTFRHNYAASQDLSALATEQVSFDFYWNGYDSSLEGRAAGTTQATLRLTFYGGASGIRESSLEIDLVNESGIFGSGLLIGWNTVVLDLPEGPAWPRFRDDGVTAINTINDVAISTSSMTAGSVNLNSLADHNDLWANVDAFEFFITHSGQGGNPNPSEGFFGIDNASFGPVPEPATLSLLALGSVLLLRHRAA